MTGPTSKSCDPTKPGSRQVAGPFPTQEPVSLPGDWYPLFPNPVVAESVLDRLINTAHHVLMDGRSYRPNKRPGRRSKDQPLPDDDHID